MELALVLIFLTAFALLAVAWTTWLIDKIRDAAHEAQPTARRNGSASADERESLGL